MQFDLIGKMLKIDRPTGIEFQYGGRFSETVDVADCMPAREIHYVVVIYIFVVIIIDNINYNSSGTLNPTHTLTQRGTEHCTR